VAGGNNGGVVRDNQDIFELSELFGGREANHSLNFGAACGPSDGTIPPAVRTASITWRRWINICKTSRAITR